MNHLNKKVAVLIAIVFSLVCVQMVSAGITYTPTYANKSEYFMLNITIGAPTGTGNITEIRIVNTAYPQTGTPFAFNISSANSSVDSGLVNISNCSLTAGQLLCGNIDNGKFSEFKWFNKTSDGLVEDGGINQSFIIYLNNSGVSHQQFYICIYNSTNSSLTRCDAGSKDPNWIEQVNITMDMNFGFTGYAKNDSGNLQPNTNITIYDYITSVTGGPPSEVPLVSAIADSNGMFRLWGINGSKTQYKIKLVYNNSVRATLVGPTLPPFPSNMFYEMTTPGNENAPKMKKRPNINGTTFYLQPAATINITAVGNVPDSNATRGNSVQFGYEVIDQAVGFPIESNVRTGVWNKEVIVPAGRDYTIITMRDPVTFLEYGWCEGEVNKTNATEMNLMNDSACPSPPTSAEVLSASLTQGGIVQKELNLSYTMQYLSGCISLSGNTSSINITKVITRLTPWTGFVPPIDAKISEFNTTKAVGNDNLNYSDPRCPGTLALYNLSLMGSASGIGYLIEFYGKNASDEASNPGSAVNLAAFQNLSMTGTSQFMNITLKPLAGAYVTNSSTVNTSKMKLFVHNSSGSDSANALTTSMHVELKVKHPIFGTMHYIIEDISNGVTYLPILANSTWAKISVYPNEAPPVEKTLNLLATQNNISVQVGEMTFRKPLSNGSLEFINVSNKGIDSSTGINMTFYRNAVGCNTPNPPDATCLLTRMDANDFNPMAVMMAGKVNLELKMTGSGTTLYFINFDLLSAKPPTNSIMNNNASSASANAQTWEAGSFVPHVYDYAYVVMPYSVTSTDSNYINESYISFNMAIPHFKDENWNVVWNRTLGNTTAQLPDDYTDYNVGAYAPLISSAGALCNTTNTTDVCYWDKGNNSFVLKVPHFSGVGSSIAGTAPAATAADATTDSGSSSGTSTAKAVSESRTFATITEDAENTYRLSDPDTIGVNAVIFTSTESLESVKVMVTKLASKPSSVSPDPDGETYRYIEVNAPKLAGKTKEAKIQFEITKAWLDDNDYEAEDVILMRFADNKWNALTTSKLSESSTKAYYEAISPGFSYFAITAQKEAAEEPVVEKETNLTADLEVAPIAAAVEEEASKISLTWLWITIGVLLVLLLAVLGYRKKHLLIFWREPTDRERQEIIRGEFLSRKKQQSFGSGKD